MSSLDLASVSVTLPAPEDRASDAAASSTVKWTDVAKLSRLPAPIPRTKFPNIVDVEGDDLIQDLIDEYFQLCETRGKRPLLTELALALGCSGPTELRRMGMRRPTVRRAISRAMTYVAAQYEGMIGTVSGPGPIFMLKNIPDFDEYEPRGSTPNYAFRDEVQVDRGTRGAEDPRDRGRELSPREAYLQLIQDTSIIEADYTEVAEDSTDLADKLDKLTK